MKTIPILLLAVLLGMACAPLPGSTPSPTPVSLNRDAEEYAVLSAVVQQGYVTEAIRQIVLSSETTLAILSSDKPLPDVLAGYQKDMPELDQPLIDDFARSNAESRPLESRLQISVPYAFLSQQEQKEIFNGTAGSTGWSAFYQKFPNSQGLMSLSRVGFNARMNKALVYVGNQSYWLAGAGYLVLLSRDTGQWQVEQREMVWIS